MEDYAAIFFGAELKSGLNSMLPSPLWSSASMRCTRTSGMTSGASSRTTCGSTRFWPKMLPFSDVEFGEALRLRPSPTSAAAPHRGGVAPGDSAEHRYGVLSHPADRKRDGCTGPQGQSAGALDPVATKETRGSTPEELEALSRIIVELNERFGIELGPEHRVTLGRMMERLEEDAALDAAAKVNTPENVRIAFDHKVEEVIQEIVDLNFDLYKRITDDPSFGEVIKNHLFDQYLTHPSA